LSDEEIESLLFEMIKEQCTRSDQKCVSTFTVSHWNGDSNCVIFPTHKSDKAFKGFHGKYPYIDKFTALVGNGDAELGAEQVLGVLSSKYSSKYLKVGQSAGLTM
jgi:hypothetical protein